ncbi:CehA/McbA family metallohydrolase [Paenibacillus hamazuiensis]|uniref:CehA/McbA family metallohydrolase n=1 Tax=Paenibacillus hamazuiensis TaxID=2936508 RepID=UPI00200D750A|nr:CehA/McbA family metallohydrolase [Paenibacillus hamazuiensis]
MTEWLPFELHCHTFHSDGKMSLEELALAAKALGLRGVALTDHNTMTGLAGREEVTRKTGIEIIPGLEWTTFFGHMLTMGIRDYVDWRNLSPFHIHRGIEAVHRQGGLVGVAHPFRVGSPMCTGCFWEFEVTDWNEVDYVEVWSGLFPSIRKNNARAFGMWTDLLNKGHRIAATSGRDWHVSDPVSEPVCATFLGIDGCAGGLVPAALDALRRGAVIVSMGPLPTLAVTSPEGQVAGVGDELRLQTGSRSARVAAGADFSAREGQWELPEQKLTLRIVSNAGTLGEFAVTRSEPSASGDISLDGVRWLRAELYGTFCGAHTMIGFTNAIYVRDLHGGSELT